MYPCMAVVSSEFAWVIGEINKKICRGVSVDKGRLINNDASYSVSTKQGFDMFSKFPANSTNGPLMYIEVSTKHVITVI